MAGLGPAGFCVLTPFLAIARRRLRGGARRLLRPLQAQDQIDQFVLAQTLELVATHSHSDSDKSLARQGVRAMSRYPRYPWVITRRVLRRDQCAGERLGANGH